MLVSLQTKHWAESAEAAILAYLVPYARLTDAQLIDLIKEVGPVGAADTQVGRINCHTAKAILTFRELVRT